MTQHFTRSTASVSAPCKKCGKNTQHRVDDVKLGPCLECVAKLEALHAAAKLSPLAEQVDLFPGIL